MTKDDKDLTNWLAIIADNEVPDADSQTRQEAEIVKSLLELQEQQNNSEIPFPHIHKRIQQTLQAEKQKVSGKNIHYPWYALAASIMLVSVLVFFQINLTNNIDDYSTLRGLNKICNNKALQSKLNDIELQAQLESFGLKVSRREPNPDHILLISKKLPSALSRELTNFLNKHQLEIQDEELCILIKRQ